MTNDINGLSNKFILSINNVFMSDILILTYKGISKNKYNFNKK